MPRGSMIPSPEYSTFLSLVSKLATSMLRFLGSVQKMFLATQSIDMPSGPWTSVNVVNISIFQIFLFLDVFSYLKTFVHRSSL